MARTDWPEGFTAFVDLHDPRLDRPLQHSLAEIVVIALCAVTAGADSWVQVAAWGRTKDAWLRTFLTLPHGIPSHDTIGRVFALLNPQQFAGCYQAWIQARVADHENEIAALPGLLDQVVVAGAVVTIDAIGCQREVAETIVDAQGDYVLALKANQPETWTATRETFAAVAAGTQTVDTLDWHETLDKGHGRLERRTCRVIADAATVAWLQTNVAGAWRGLRTLVEVQAWCRRGETMHEETRYCLSSLEPDAARLNRIVRRHWAIENELHWVLDVVFDEDRSRIRQGYAAENAALLRKIAVGLLTQETVGKESLKGKRLKAGWDDSYLARVLGVPAPPAAP